MSSNNNRSAMLSENISSNLSARSNHTDEISYDGYSCISGKSFYILGQVVFNLIILPMLFGNILILLSVIKFRNLHSSAYLLIANLAVADLLLGFDLILVTADFVNPKLQAIKNLCLFKYSVFVISLGESVYTLLLMSVERYLSVKYPLKHLIYAKNKTYVVSIIIASWVFLVVSGSLPFFGVLESSGDIMLHHPHECYYQSVQTNYELISVTFSLVIILLTVALYIPVFKAALARTMKLPRSKAKISGLKTRLMFVVFCVFTVCWLPFVIVTIILRIYDTITLRCVRHWAVYLGIFNSGINWSIYGTLNLKMRSAFLTLLCKGRFCRS